MHFKLYYYDFNNNELNIHDSQIQSQVIRTRHSKGIHSFKKFFDIFISIQKLKHLNVYHIQDEPFVIRL